MKIIGSIILSVFVLSGCVLFAPIKPQPTVVKPVTTTGNLIGENGLIGTNGLIGENGKTTVGK